MFQDKSFLDGIRGIVIYYINSISTYGAHLMKDSSKVAVENINKDELQSKYSIESYRRIVSIVMLEVNFPEIFYNQSTLKNSCYSKEIGSSHMDDL